MIKVKVVFKGQWVFLMTLGFKTNVLAEFKMQDLHKYFQQCCNC